jgi:hypothetical protein
MSVVGHHWRMTWFGGVPWEIRIAGASFVLADEALELADVEGLPDDERPDAEVGERPSPDWAATALLLLARVQLDQMVDLLGRVVGGDISGWEPARVAGAVRRRVAAASVDLLEEVAFELEALAEGLLLRSALREISTVDHGFAVDGSITLTTGPEIPALEILGIRGSWGTEMNVEPDQVFRTAAQLTRDAARVVALLQRAEKGGRNASERAVPTGATVDADERGAERVDRAGAGPEDRELASCTYTCVFCSQERTLTLPARGLERWRAGASLSEAFPSLAGGTREELGSGICPDCQDDILDG